MKSHCITGFMILVAAGSTAAAAVAPKADLTPVAAFSHQVTGIAVTADGRRFVNFPRWTDDAPISVGEVMADGSVTPYPDLRWNSWRNVKASELPVGDFFVCVQSIVADGHGNLWVVDPGAPGNEKILPMAPKLVKIDLASNRVVKVIPGRTRRRAARYLLERHSVLTRRAYRLHHG